MSRHSSFDGISEEQESQYEAEKIRSVYRYVARLFQWYSNHPSILPVYVRNTSKVPALAVDFLADCYMSARRVLGRAGADTVLWQIAEEGWETVDPEIQTKLGEEWSRTDLLNVYSAVTNKRARDDAGIPREHRVQWTESIESEMERIEAEDEVVRLLADTVASELEEAPQEDAQGNQQNEPEIDWFGSE